MDKETTDIHNPELIEQEQRFHRYIGNRIPWFVHLIWVSYWIFCIWYIISFQLPVFKPEFLNPP